MEYFSTRLFQRTISYYFGVTTRIYIYIYILLLLFFKVMIFDNDQGISELNNTDNDDVESLKDKKQKIRGDWD